MLRIDNGCNPSCHRTNVLARGGDEEAGNLRIRDGRPISGDRKSDLILGFHLLSRQRSAPRQLTTFLGKWN